MFPKAKKRTRAYTYMCESRVSIPMHSKFLAKSVHLLWHEEVTNIHIHRNLRLYNISVIINIGLGTLDKNLKKFTDTNSIY